MLQEKLKNATAKSHDELELLMFVGEIMNKTLTSEQYKSLLITNYLVHSEYEGNIHQMLNDTLKNDLQIEKRSKLESLKLDLEEAGINSAQIDREFVDLPLLNFNYSSMLGAMYVLEGATLGGNVIYKKLMLNSNLTDLGYKFHYYSVYAADLMPHWISFVKTINIAPQVSEDQAAEGASSMFNAIATISKQVNASSMVTSS
jgi:heme oxygenase